MQTIKKEENGLMTNDLVFAKVKQDAIIPTKEDENAGYDIYACFDEDYMIVPAHSTKLIPTGIAAAVCDKYYLQVHERGSTGSKGMKYGAGVVDSSYRGEIFICINNVNDRAIIISKLNDINELFDKCGVDDGGGYFYLPYDINHPLDVDEDGYETPLGIYEDDDDEIYDHIFYPYSKAIAQLIVHEVPKMNAKEISYEELQAIPSKRGTGALGSSGK